MGTQVATAAKAHKAKSAAVAFVDLPQLSDADKVRHGSRHAFFVPSCKTHSGPSPAPSSRGSSTLYDPGSAILGSTLEPSSSPKLQGFGYLS